MEDSKGKTCRLIWYRPHVGVSAQAPLGGMRVVLFGTFRTPNKGGLGIWISELRGAGYHCYGALS